MAIDLVSEDNVPLKAYKTTYPKSLKGLTPHDSDLYKDAGECKGYGNWRSPYSWKYITHTINGDKSIFWNMTEPEYSSTSYFKWEGVLHKVKSEDLRLDDWRNPHRFTIGKPHTRSHTREVVFNY